MSLAVISTHPIQYQAPVYRALHSQFGIPTTVIYGSDFSVAGYRDREFGASFAWDSDLLGGYDHVFLSTVANGGAASDKEVTAKGAASVLYNLHPQAVLLLGYRWRFDLRAFAAARRRGTPLLFRAETADHTRQRSPMKQALRDTFLRLYYGQFRRLLYIGQNSLAHYRRLGCSEEKLVFSPYGVDTSPFRVSEEDRRVLRDPCREKLFINVDEVVLLFSGKLVARKAPDVLLKAVKELPDPLRQRIVVVFVGDGEMRPALEQMAAETPQVGTRFVGFQNQSQLSDFYHAADLFILPSISGETWGLVVNEALHHGLPCIVTEQVGCAPDLVKLGVSGELCEAGSSQALAAAIQRGLGLTQRAEGRSACREIVSHYSIETAAAGIAQAYHAVAGSEAKQRA